MRYRTGFRLIGALVIGLAAPACTHGASSAKADGEARYDGTQSGFERFVARYDKPWPVPDELGMFQGQGGASLRYAHWQAPEPDRPAGVVVFFQGRTEFIEKNIDAYHDLLERNYAVWTLDWRGQGLSERLLPKTPEKGHIDSYETYLADAEIFLRDVVRLDEIEDRPKILLAHSMGGGIGTLYLLRHPDAFDKAMFSAPLIRLPSDVDNRLIRAGNRAKITVAPAACAGFFTDCLWRSEFGDDVDVCALAEENEDTAEAALRDAAASARYTHDAVRMAEIECWIVNSRPAVPSLGLGGATSGWLRATYDATDRIHADKSGLSTPLLMIGGGQDETVSNDGQRAFCDADNPQCCRLEFADAGHELLIELEPIRQRFFDAFDAFVEGSESADAFCARRR